MKPPISRVAILGFVIGLVAILAVAGAALAYRTGSVTLRTAFSILRMGAYGGAVAAVVSLIGFVLARRGFRRGVGFAMFGLIAGALAFGVPANQLKRARGLPPIHDITTDTEDPPAFFAVLPLRASAPNKVEYGGAKVAAQQRQAYPDVVPVIVPLPPAQAFERAFGAVRAMGWQLVAADPAAGRIEATDVTLWFGFKDDVVVRVRPTDGGSRIDVRSLSRVGGGDVGTNARRVRAYLKKLTES